MIHRNFGRGDRIKIRDQKLNSLMAYVNYQENHKKIIATRYHIFSLKCTKFGSGWGPLTDPAGELKALPQMP